MCGLATAEHFIHLSFPTAFFFKLSESSAPPSFQDRIYASQGFLLSQRVYFLLVFVVSSYCIHGWITLPSTKVTNSEIGEALC